MPPRSLAACRGVMRAGARIIGARVGALLPPTDQACRRAQTCQGAAWKQLRMTQQ